MNPPMLKPPKSVHGMKAWVRSCSPGVIDDDRLGWCVVVTGTDPDAVADFMARLELRGYKVEPDPRMVEAWGQ